MMRANDAIACSLEAQFTEGTALERQILDMVKGV